MSPTLTLLPLDFEAALQKAWCPETTICWSPERPSSGHCAVTALCVQDALGGEIVRAIVGGSSHYWTRVGDNDIDLTRDQFDEFVVEEEPQIRSRAYLLANADTRRRYELLRSRLLQLADVL